MKNLILTLISVLLIGFDSIALADRIIIKVPQEPLQVREESGTYLVTSPSSTITTTDTYYFTTNDKKMICFTSLNDNLNGLEIFTFSFGEGQTQKLYCTYDLDQFDIQTLPSS